MRIDNDKNLKFIAESCKKSLTEVSDIIVSSLIENGIILDEPYNWGCKLSECHERDVTISEMVEILKKSGVCCVKSEHVDALYGCVLMGDGGCPDCGGEMEVIDGEYEHDGGDGYMTPVTKKAIWEEMECKNCHLHVRE